MTTLFGQNNMPQWSDFEKIFSGIFERKFYTNHGPLLKQLEAELEKTLGVKHAVCMTNASIAMMISALALGLKGKVLVDAKAPVQCGQSIEWAGLKAVTYDTVEQIEKFIDKDVSAIFASHLAGMADVERLEEVAAKHKLKLYFDAANGFGNSYKGRNIAGIGNLTIFSFNQSHIINASEGGCVCTNDDELAERLRNVRSSYGVRKTVEIPFTGNGRMSEAQAAMALLSLGEFEKNVARNKKNFENYKKALSVVRNVELLHHQDNYEVIAVRTSDIHKLQAALKKNNIEAKILADALMLPNGSEVDEKTINEICDVIKKA